MNGYLATWLARYGGALLLAGVWAGFAVRAWRRGRRLQAAGFLALSGVTGGALWTHLGPLVRGELVPDDPAGLTVALAAPFVGFAALALTRRREPTVGMDPASLLPVALVGHGWPAWAFAVVTIGRGSTLPGAARRGLLVGIGLLALSTAIDAQRSALVTHVPLGSDGSARVVAAATAAPETVGWLFVGAWAARRDAVTGGRT